MTEILLTGEDHAKLVRGKPVLYRVNGSDYLIRIENILDTVSSEKAGQAGFHLLGGTEKNIRDLHTVEMIAKLHPLIRDKATNLISEVQNELGVTLRITRGLVTWEQQQKVYDIGRKTEGRIRTKAAPGQSYHNYGLAFDVVHLLKGGKSIDYHSSDDEWWNEIGKIGKAFGLEWGGDWENFVDRPHFQYRAGKHWRDMLILHNDKTVDTDGYIILT